MAGSLRLPKHPHEPLARPYSINNHTSGREGIDAAFAGLVPAPVPASVTPELVAQLLASASLPERDALLAEHPELEPVLQLSQPQDLAHKVVLLRAALTLAEESHWREGPAIVHFELGRAFTEPQLGDQDAAIAHFEQALTRCGPDTYPLPYLEARQGIVRANFAARDWAAALPAWEQAIALGDSMLDAAYTTIGRQSEAGTVAEAYRNAAYCLLRLGRPAEALLTIERGKTRLLNQTLAMAVQRWPASARAAAAESATSIPAA